ncbi:unnamed protein product, partial [Sphacelaria rigidula]
APLERKSARQQTRPYRGCQASGMGADTKCRYRTPGPGAYDVRKASRQCLKVAPSSSFGGTLNQIDREKTGPLKVVRDKNYVPGPCSYAIEAENQ